MTSWDWQQAEQGEDQLLWRPEHRVAGRESGLVFQQRIGATLAELLATPPAGRIVAVVHSGVIDVMLRWAFGVPAEQPWTTEADVAHASITGLRHWPNRRQPGGTLYHTLLIRIGDVRHLPVDLHTG